VQKLFTSVGMMHEIAKPCIEHALEPFKRLSSINNIIASAMQFKSFSLMKIFCSSFSPMHHS